MAEPVATRPWYWPRVPRWRWVAATVGWRPPRGVVLPLVFCFGALAGTVAFGLVRADGQVGPGELEVRLRPSFDAITEVALPPLGEITAATHRAPVAVEVRLDQLDVDRLQRLFLSAQPDEVAEREVRDDLVPLLRRLLFWALLTGAVAGAIAGAVLPHRRWSFVVLGAVGGLVAVASLSLATWRTYDTTAFNQPQFEGPLERAPSVISAVRRHVAGLDQVQDRVQALTVQVADLYSATAADTDDSLGDTVILHISDIHSNPLGLEIAGRLARSFSADAIVDTGDLTSFGLPVEARIADQIAGLGVPYYLVPGNHDSPENRAAIGAVPGVELIDGDVVTIGSVRVLGAGDPTFTASNEISTAEANETKLDQAPELARLVRRLRPDVLAVHDLRSASASTGAVPVVLAGHTHKRSMSSELGTLELVVGSSGATGVESFLVEEQRAYEFELLRFRAGDLVAVDYVSLRGVAGAFRIDRRVIEAGEAVARPPSGTSITPR